MTFVPAQRRGHTVGSQDGLEFFLPFPRRARPIEAFDGVVRDKIDPGRQSPRAPVQLAPLFVGVVDAGDQDVLERQSSFIRHVVIARFE